MADGAGAAAAPPPAKKKKQKTIIEVLEVTAEGGQPIFNISVRAGDTEPFTVKRSYSALSKFALEIVKAYEGKTHKGAAVTLPEFPVFTASGAEMNEAFLNVTRAVVQAYFDEAVGALPTSSERVVFGRALEVDLETRQERAVPQSKTARNAATAALVAKVGVNAMGTNLANQFRSDEGQKAGIMSQENIDRIVDHVSKMRGAALKIAQKLNSMRHVMQVNPKLQEALDKRVLNWSMSMPHSQVWP